MHQRRPPDGIILDMDSSESPTHGEQEGSAYNGHFGCTCYHPLFVFNQFGDLERVMLRRGNHHSAKFWRRVLLPVIARYRGLKVAKFFRGDAAFASPKLMKLLEAEGCWVAVGNALSGVPPRRSVRAELPHTAPTSGDGGVRAKPHTAHDDGGATR